MTAPATHYDRMLAAMRAGAHFSKSERDSRYSRSGPRGAGNTGSGLTHSLDVTKEGLMPNYTQTCSVADCRQLVGRKGARGLCTRHYQRLLLTGSPTGSTRPTIEERFWRYASASMGCWLWSGSLDSSGYGQLSVHGVTTKAHRYAYELLVGPIPDGLQIDHLCRNRACCNPEHLEPVTLAENVRRGRASDVSQGRRTHCRNGHPFTASNTYTNPLGRKVCRTCSASSRLNYQLRSAS